VDQIASWVITAHPGGVALGFVCGFAFAVWFWFKEINGPRP